MASRSLVISGRICFGAFVTFCLSALRTTSKAEDETTERIPRVAIIGSGIGGSSAAYFLRQILGPSTHIQVFERADKVGGRLATIDIAGDLYESGGSIIHGKNMYMKTFVKELGLGTLKKSDNGIFSLYDGSKIVFQTSYWSWLSTLKLLWRYGLSLIKMNSIIQDLLGKFSNIYTLQDHGEVFQSVPDMLQAIGGVEFYTLTQLSVREYLQEKGLSELLIDELVTAVMRINYGQSTEMNAFAGCVSLAGAEPGLWAVEGGNWKVCEGLLERSKTIINKKTQIIEIFKKTTPDREQPSYYLRSDKGLISTHFDVVIVAVPLEIKHNFIGCDGCSRWPHQQQLGEFQQTVATFLKGKINENTFKFCSELPSTIGTMEKPEICFSSVGKQTSVWNKKLHGQEQVWKVFSREPLTKECTEKLFSRRDDAKSVVWLAYPHYTPPEKFLPFVLDEGIFYVNAIEWAASAMEMSALSGKNAALLAAQFLKKGKSLTSKHQEGHEEL